MYVYCKTVITVAVLYCMGGVQNNGAYIRRYSCVSIQVWSTPMLSSVAVQVTVRLDTSCYPDWVYCVTWVLCERRYKLQPPPQRFIRARDRKAKQSLINDSVFLTNLPGTTTFKRVSTNIPMVSSVTAFAQSNSTPHETNSHKIIQPRAHTNDH
jgi:hypothetical protein